LAGLDQDYNSFVENVAGKTETSLGVLYSQLLAAEARMELQTPGSQQFQSSSVNSIACGRGGYCDRGGGGRGGFGCGFDDRGEPRSSKKTGHTMIHC
jgi:hypothetical protein